MGFFPIFLCLFVSSASASSPNPAEIRIQLAANPSSLDPAIADDDYSVKVLLNTMDGLFGYDPTGKLENRLAAKIESKNGGLRYEATLRKGTRWSDGVPITADQFVVGIRRSLDPKTGSKIASLLFVLKGAKAFYSGKGTAAEVGVHAEGDRVVFDLEKPTPYFPHLLTISQTGPMRADILKASGGKWPNTAPGTGPYRITRYKTDSEIRLEPNPKYWNARKGRHPILLRIVPDESTAVTLFESGMLDIVSKVPPYDLARFRKLGRVRSFPQAATYFFSFNARKPPFNSPAARRAISGAVDRAGTVKLLDGANIPATGWIPPSLEGGVDEKAMIQRLVKDLPKNGAGLKKTKTPIVAAYSANVTNGVVMEKLQNDVLKKLGVKLSLSTMDWKAYLSAIRTDAPNLYRFQRGAPFMDPIWHLASFMSDDPNNPTGWKNAAYDRLVEKISSTPSGPARKKLIAQADKILVEDEAIVVPVFYAVVSYLVAPRITGFAMDPLNGVSFSDLGIKSKAP
jgi:ABC-type oligopeptide transport system substrate-binding subunit